MMNHMVARTSYRTLSCNTLLRQQVNNIIIKRHSSSSFSLLCEQFTNREELQGKEQKKQLQLLLQEQPGKKCQFSSISSLFTNNNNNKFCGCGNLLSLSRKNDFVVIQPKNMRYFSSSSNSNNNNSSSSSSSSSSYNPLEWWKHRQTKQEEEKFQLRTVQMANEDTWRLKNLLNELQEATGWKSKIPGISSTKEVKMAKEMKGIVDVFVEMKGENATYEELEILKKLDKLRIAQKAGVTLEAVNTVLDQFGNMSLIQKVLRQRQIDGKKLPMTPDKLQFIVQAEGMKHMSNKQMNKMKELAKKRFGRIVR